MTTHPPLAKRPLIALVALAAASALWALFLWGQLMLIRSGGAAFCAAEGAVDCASVWDSPLASAVHSMTRVPVAGWGLMWGLMAFAVSLAALGDPDRGVARGLVTSLRLIGIAGAASVVGLLGASIADGHICTGCIGTYLVVGAWSALAFVGTKGLGFAEPQRGVMVTGAALVASYLVLLYPGMHTPRSMTSLGKEALAKVGSGKADPTPAADPHAGHDHGPNVDHDAAPGPVGTRPLGPSPFDGPGTGNPENDQALEALMSDLPPEARQLMSDFLLEFENAKPAAQVPQGRVVLGDPASGVRVVDWTDPLCPHCADLHAALDELRRITPGGFATEPHLFPLDGLCNGEVQRKSEGGPVRCLASKALVCLEGDPDKFALGQKVLFENQAGLTPERVFEVLKPFTDRKKLDACIASPDTQAKLDLDIAAGKANRLEGTPLVLLNGREVKPWPPLIYALALTGGKTKHSAFKVLPPPKNRQGPVR
ncbi:MAG: hypothetical protein IT383_02200 [Deltaproteobacteria bacterium]|nr:hypothetical protein [Deltaproteobacteria bacterium]